MDKFLKEYENYKFEYLITVCSDDFKSFTRKFKGFLKRNLPGDCELIGFKPNHYDFSGFVKHGNEYIYVRYSWNRLHPLSITRDDTLGGVLVRFAKNEKDYKGENNRFTCFKDLPDFLVNMFVERGMA